MKSALSEKGLKPVPLNVQEGQMWKRLSIMGLMDRVERVFSLYPFSNARLLDDEARRLAILKA